ncbi:MAG: type II CRISPR-associated endonuclease Cas1 [Alphaproteobacteria bacterium]|nr:type II CRISPR-associated endonuclease Cas1 [Alphaproteobacteria bacterium]
MQSIVEISQDGRHISLFRGFLKISEHGEELARIPLDAIHAVLLNCHRATLSQNILLQCANGGIPVILCGSNHQPAGVLWPVISHHKQAGNLHAQLHGSVPLAKQLWKKLVQCKIAGQHEVLQKLGKSRGNELEAMARRVKSGDPDNLEAQAARRYWPLLMGEGFTRNPDLDGANALLNYGYAILRSTVSRAVMAAGLHPSLGVHHQNRLNAFCLVDDVMEPFRPFVDFYVWELLQSGHNGVTRETKTTLAAITEQAIAMPSGVTTLANACLLIAQSLALAFTERKPLLALPVTLFAQPKLPDIEH